MNESHAINTLSKIFVPSFLGAASVGSYTETLNGCTDSDTKNFRSQKLATYRPFIRGSGRAAFYRISQCLGRSKKKVACFVPQKRADTPNFENDTREIGGKFVFCNLKMLLHSCIFLAAFEFSFF